MLGVQHITDHSITFRQHHGNDSTEHVALLRAEGYLEKL